MQHDPQRKKTKGNSKYQTAQKCIQFIRKLEWNFWADSGWAVLGLVIATFLVAPIFEFVGDNVKIYAVVTGFCFATWVGAMFVAHSTILHSEGRTTEQRETRQEEEKRQLQNKVDHLESDLADAREKLKEFEPRFISGEQWRKIGAAISQFAHQKASVWYQMDDTEGRRYAQQFIHLFRESTWDINSLVATSDFGPFDGAIVCLSEADRDNRSLPPAGIALSNVLADLGVTANADSVLFDKIPQGEVRLLIGIKKISRAKAMISTAPSTRISP